MKNFNLLFYVLTLNKFSEYCSLEKSAVELMVLIRDVGSARDHRRLT